MRNNIIIQVLFFFFTCFFSGNLSSQEYKLVWEENFNYNGKLNPAIWNFEKGFVRNNELQWYQEDNSWCENGLLIIEGRHEKVKNPHYSEGSNNWRQNRNYAEYTSSSVNTRGKKRIFIRTIRSSGKNSCSSGFLACHLDIRR